MGASQGWVLRTTHLKTSFVLRWKRTCLKLCFRQYYILFDRVLVRKHFGANRLKTRSASGENVMVDASEQMFSYDYSYDYAVWRLAFEPSARICRQGQAPR